MARATLGGRAIRACRPLVRRHAPPAPKPPGAKGTTLPLEGARTLKLTTDEGTWLSLDVSPDGRTIVFVSDRDGPDQLYVVDVGSSKVFRLTSGQADKDTPAWRP